MVFPRSGKKQILVSLEELKPGDFMVHLDFGLGIYRGLQHLEFDRIGEDFLLLEYAGGTSSICRWIG